MDETYYTVDVDVRETVEVNISLRDCLNGIKSIKNPKDRLNIAFKLLEAVKVGPEDLSPEHKEIAINWLEITLHKFKDI